MFAAHAFTDLEYTQRSAMSQQIRSPSDACSPYARHLTERRATFTAQSNSRLFYARILMPFLHDVA